jgi:thiol-disulfide isomerase/thioredoxin
MKDLVKGFSIDEILKENDFVLFYFSTPECNVCKHLKPKIEDLIKKYEKINSYYVNLHEHNELSGRFSVFSIPAIILFINGSETIREGRYISLDDFDNKVSRYYEMFYSE